MSEELIKNNENHLQNEKKVFNEFDPSISQGPLRLLGLIAIFSFIAGFFITLGILVDIKQNKNLMFTHGLTIGLLLFIAGIFLLISVIILNKKSNNKQM